MKNMRLVIMSSVMATAMLFTFMPVQGQDNWPSCRTNFNEVCTSGTTEIEGGSIEWEIAGERNSPCPGQPCHNE